jgi:hypothetical protein
LSLGGLPAHPAFADAEVDAALGWVNTVAGEAEGLANTVSSNAMSATQDAVGELEGLVDAVNGSQAGFENAESGARLTFKIQVAQAISPNVPPPPTGPTNPQPLAAGGPLHIPGATTAILMSLFGSDPLIESILPPINSPLHAGDMVTIGGPTQLQNLPAAQQVVQIGEAFVVMVYVIRLETAGARGAGLAARGETRLQAFAA